MKLFDWFFRKKHLNVETYFFGDIATSYAKQIVQYIDKLTFEKLTDMQLIELGTQITNELKRRGIYTQAVGNLTVEEYKNE
jgi:hypothetical protein